MSRNGRLNGAERPGKSSDQPGAGAGGPLSLSELAALLPTREGRRPRVDRLDRDDRCYRWAIRLGSTYRSPTFRSSFVQAAAGMGYPTTGDRDADYARLGNNVRRALDSLQGAGVLRWRGLRTRRGRWSCIQVTLLPLAGLTRPASGSWGGSYGRRPLADHRTPAGRWRARERGACSSGPGSAPCRVFYAHRAESVTSPPEGGGTTLEGIDSLPARERAGPPMGGRLATSRAGRGAAGRQRGKPARSRARAARLARRDRLIRAFEDAFGTSARFSHRKHGRALDRALDRLDRYAYPDGQRAGAVDSTGAAGAWLGLGPATGAGVDFAAALVAARAADLAAPIGWRDPIPGSLAFFVPILDEASKDFRRANRPAIKRARSRAPSKGAPVDSHSRPPQHGDH